jgi:uncharacterized protein (DUF433 family)
MPTQTSYPHLDFRADGAAIILPSGFKVRMLIQAYLASDMNATTLHDMYPDLTMGQIHSALAYYWDHQTAVDAEIVQKDAFAERILSDLPKQPSRAELKKRLENH